MSLHNRLENEIKQSVITALREDIGAGDITAMLIPESENARANIITREPSVMCGRAWADAVCNAVEGRIAIDWQVEDGDALEADQVLCSIEGAARTLLSAERCILNFLQTLMGVATLSREYAHAVKGYRAEVLDTRKTIPGLRLAQKYAVRTGGCKNHRIGLYDAYLIKENHIMAAGSIAAAIAQARINQPAATVEVEVESLEQLEQSLRSGADIVMLDNFDIPMIEKAVAMNKDRAKLEVSGNVELQSIKALAATGVDYISTGALTKHLRAIDLSMRFSDSK